MAFLLNLVSPNKMTQNSKLSSFSLATDIPIEKLKAHMNCIQYSYKPKSSDNPQSSDYLYTTPIVTDQQNGYVHVQKDAKIIHIVFKGTKTLEDFVADIDIKADDYQRKGKRLLQVHQGFHERAVSCYPVIVVILQNIMKELSVTDLYDYEILIGGHSLGGAAALMLFMMFTDESNRNDWLNCKDDYSSNGRNRYKCITTGQPKLLLCQDPSDFDMNPKNILRFVNPLDVVPTFPSSFCHVGTAYKVEFNKATLSERLLEKLFPLKKIQRCHNNETYAVKSIDSFAANSRLEN